MPYDDRKPTAPDHRLPPPEEQRGAVLADNFADSGYADRQRLANSFADPNALDDTRLGNAFEETNSSAKKKHHLPHVHTPPAGSKSRRILWIFVVCVLVLFLLIFFVGWLPRHNRDKETERRSEALQHAEPTVEVL